MNLNGKTLAYGFVAGTIAVVIFHQGMIFLLWLAGLVPAFPWSLRPIAGPVPTPSLLNNMFWGGLWGVAFAMFGRLLPIAHDALRGAVLGLIGPWFLGGGILLPLIKGGAFFWSWPAQRYLIGALILSSFGAGWAMLMSAAGRR